MSLDAWLTVGILVTTFGFLFFTKIPPPTVFLGALTVSVTLGLAPLGESLKGFSNVGVLTVAALFIVAAGMYSTGAISILGDKLVGRPRNLTEAQIRILPPVAIGSAFLNNTPLVAMMIPVIKDLCRTTGLSSSRLYIPLSYASILGGMGTLIGTSVNLIIAGLVIDALGSGGAQEGLRELQMFDPARVGVPAAAVGIGFMILFARFLLPDRDSGGRAVTKRLYTAEFEVPEYSPLIGQSLGSTGLTGAAGYELAWLEREDASRPSLESDTPIVAGDQLSFSTDIDNLPTLWAIQGILPVKTTLPVGKPRHTHHLTEVVISPRSDIVGWKIADLPRPGTPYRVALVAMSRDGQPVEGKLDDQVVQIGDNAVLEVDDDFFFNNENDQVFSLVKRLRGFRLRRWEHAIEATVITAGMVAAAALGLMSMLNAAMLAAGAMLITGCMTLRTAARSVDWGTIVVLAAAIGLAAAVTNSGLSGVIATELTALGGDNAHIALAVVFIGQVIMANLITNAAAAVFMFPIALAIAGQLGVSFMPFAITLMTGTIGSTITPTAFQTNLMVMGPGGYVFSDYLRMGLPLTILVGAIAVILAPIFFPF